MARASSTLGYAWESWAVADLATPAPSRTVRRVLLSVAAIATAAVVARYGQLALLAAGEHHFSLEGWFPADVYLVLAAAVLALYSCRQQLLSQPSALLWPVATHCAVAAGVALALDPPHVDAFLSQRWLVALLVVQLGSMPIATRLWGLLLSTHDQPVERSALGVALVGYEAVTILGARLLAMALNP